MLQLVSDWEIVIGWSASCSAFILGSSLGVLIAKCQPFDELNKPRVSLEAPNVVSQVQFSGHPELTGWMYLRERKRYGLHARSGIFTVSVGDAASADTSFDMNTWTMWHNRRSWAIPSLCVL